MLEIPKRKRLAVTNKNVLRYAFWAGLEAAAWTGIRTVCWIDQIPIRQLRGFEEGLIPQPSQ